MLVRSSRYHLVDFQGQTCLGHAAYFRRQQRAESLAKGNLTLIGQQIQSRFAFDVGSAPLRLVRVSLLAREA
jgi:hypothetical protein